MNVGKPLHLLFLTDVLACLGKVPDCLQEPFLANGGQWRTLGEKSRQNACIAARFGRGNFAGGGHRSIGSGDSLDIGLLEVIDLHEFQNPLPMICLIRHVVIPIFSPSQGTCLLNRVF